MALRPDVSDSAETLYDSLGPWSRADTALAEWCLLDLCEATAGRLQLVEDLIRDTDAGPGWSILLDVDRAPEQWLPWLAQLVGARTRAGLPAVEQRARIRNTDGFKRGSPAALAAAASQYLTGTKYVIINERLGGAAYQLGVLTLTSETPDPQAVLAALLEQKPAGIILDHAVVPGQNYDAVRIGFDLYSNLAAGYTDYDDMALNLP